MIARAQGRRRDPRSASAHMIPIDSAFVDRNLLGAALELEPVKPIGIVDPVGTRSFESLDQLPPAAGIAGEGINAMTSTTAHVAAIRPNPC